VATYDVSVAVLPWRNNLAFNNAALVAVEQPANLLGNYHLNTGSPAQNAGAASKAVPANQAPPATLAAPTIDFDNQGRPGGGSFDIGADEVDGTTGGGGGGGGGATFPTLTVLDTFNRANANTLGGNWSQVTLLGAAAIRVNTNQASDVLLTGQAIWNGAGNVFGAKQGAAFTFANTTLNGSSLILKAGGGATPNSFIRVLYNGGQVVVATTTNGGGSYTQRGSNLAATFANGDTLTALVDATGTVTVWKTSGATTTLVGSVTITGTGFWTGTGRIGMQVPANGRVDNFSGGTVTP